MSLFDFPRLNFNGRLIMHVATANNAFYHPLLIFDPLHSEPVFPPAVQLTQKQVDEFKKRGIIPKDSLDEKTNRVVILPVDSEEVYLKWATTPLGECPSDVEYHELYKSVERINEAPEVLTGAVPGYWNFYGDMSYVYEDVHIAGITTYEPGSVSTFTPEHHGDCPEDLSRMLGAELTLSDPAMARSNTGIMCDVNAEGTSVTQLFCDCVTLFNDSQTFFKGNPGKATTRMMSFPKVVNADPGPEQGAAQFVWTIPVEDLSEHDELLATFQNHYQGDGEIAGIMIRQLIHQVFEVRDPVYENIGTDPNPALSMITGSITPWIKGDMRTCSTGRVMHPVGPAIQVPIPGSDPPSMPGMINPMVVRVQPDEKIVSLDVLSSFPEVITVQPVRGATTLAPDTKLPVCQTAELGTFELRSQVGNKTAVAKVSQAMYSTDAIAACGGVFDLPFDPGLTGVDPSSISFKLFSDHLGRFVSAETPYFVASDQGGIYADQGDSADLFMNDGLPLEPCRMTIYKNGSPLKTPEPFLIQQVVMTAGAPNVAPYLNLDYPHQKQPLYLEDGTEMLNVFDTGKAGTFVYVLIPPGQPMLQAAGDFNPVLQSYVTVRILSDANKIEASLAEPPDWSTVYDRVFRLYSLIYPAMTEVLPFTDKNWGNGTMAGMVVHLIDLKKWASSQYMPRTRDLSRWQRNLLKAWASQYGVDVSMEEQPDESTRLTFRK